MSLRGGVYGRVSVWSAASLLRFFARAKAPASRTHSKRFAQFLSLTQNITVHEERASIETMNLQECGQPCPRGLEHRTEFTRPRLSTLRVHGINYKTSANFLDWMERSICARD